MLTAVPIELHRFLLKLDSPPQFRDWLYANLEIAEHALSRADFLALLELDFGDRHQVIELVDSLGRRILPLPPLGEVEDLEDHLVLGDQLQAEGDPRGELIMMQASLLSSGQHVLSEAELLERHEAELLGPLAPFVHRGVLRLEWFMGFIARAALRVVDPREAGSIIRTLLAHPSGRRLRALEAELEDWSVAGGGFGPITDALGAIPSHLSTLILDPFEEILRFDLGDVASLFRMQASLRAVELAGSCRTLGPLPPEIASFTLRTFTLTRDQARALASSHAPLLERLELWFGRGDAHPADLEPLLKRERLPLLRHLLLPAVFHGHDELIDLLLASDLLPGLATLDLSRGRMSPAAGRMLLASARMLAHLDRIDLRWNGLSESMCAELARTFPRAHVRDQWMDELEIRRTDLRGEAWW